MRITFVISSLGFGGAERVMVTMANYWAGKGWPITLDHADPAYSLDPRVQRVGLGVMAPSQHPLQAIARNLRRVGALRRSIAASQPDVVISFMDRTNVLTLLATRGLGLPVVVSDRVDPILYPPGWAFVPLRRFLYPRAAAVVLQTHGVLNRYPLSIRRNSSVIPNPVVEML